MQRKKTASHFLARKCSRAVPVKTESLEPLYLFVFTHYPTQKIAPHFLARKCFRGFRARCGHRAQ
ncbi:hypothetical protein GHC20_14020 [Brucella sp. 2280]|nr:hypothetical protein GHC20_14020 [Brucella sp. 2280]